MTYRYSLLAQVQHRITDVVTLTVEAENEDEAFDKAKRVLEVYPRPHEEDGVPYCYVEHRIYDDTKVIEIENMEDDEDSA